MNKSLLWKGLLALAVAVVPSFFTYLAARADSDEAKIRAEVAYVAMQENVKALQEASYTQALQLAAIEGQLRAERVRVEMKMPESIHPTSIAPDADGVPDVPVKLPPPRNFYEAVQHYKAKQ